MPFFLIGKGPDDSLRLLAEGVFETRASAMSELSRVTADPGFDAWDCEVLVADLDAATPVLLVRPAASQVVEPEEVEPADEVGPTDEVGPSEGEPAEDDGAVAADTQATPTVDEADESLAAVIEGLDDESDAAPDLKEALRRSAVSLEAEGIVAPESVGPVEPDEPDLPAEEEPVDEGADPLAEPPSDAMVVEAQIEGADEGSWPWAVKPDVSPLDLDALDEPGDDEGSLVRAPGDDATMASSRPVILGAYDEVATVSEVDVLLPPAADDQSAPGPDGAESSPVSEPHKPEIPVPPVIPPSSPASLPAADNTGDSAAADPTAGESAQVSDDLDVSSTVAGDSDFVDLPPVVATDPLDTMTCDDCVYHDTCPNKGQRDPASCGSFQWM
ncbi:MAG: hypothetical protein U1E26_05035 [Coriobacteriia bacterium]|nr:hypothetical protein [Coriobacteriia bacterium]